MVAPGDLAARVAELERLLHAQRTATHELERLVHHRTADLRLATERANQLSRLVGTRTALVLLAQHGTLERAAPNILEALGQSLGWQAVHLLTLDPATRTMRRRVRWGALSDAAMTLLVDETFEQGIGLPGRVWSTARPQWSGTLSADSVRAAQAGFRTGCAFPIVVGDGVHAIIELLATELREADRDLVEMLGALGRQLGKLIELSNARDQQRIGEMQVAQHIQTAILPRNLAVDRLEVAAHMVPATEVGGDYYDVLPFDGGAWFGIGDVTGHGIGAGMIMLMVQSAVAALTRDPSRVSPRDIVNELNLFLYDNIRSRLRERDHVTFSLLRYTSDGLVRFAGAHEDIVVWRARKRRCEVIETPGVWVGAVPTIAGMTQERQLQLDPGDVLVLYTDGLIDARNAKREFYGPARLCDAIAELAASGKPMTQLCDGLLERALRWCATQDDEPRTTISHSWWRAITVTTVTTISIRRSFSSAMRERPRRAGSGPT
jgi:serine phosphatase RsbU (regulator of sigma subunit)